MSDGLDSLADSKAPAYLMNILESKPQMTYQGQEFAGPLAGASSQDVSIQDNVQTFEMFGGIEQQELLGTDQTLDTVSAPRNTVGN
jgi:hypothetical protein